VPGRGRVAPRGPGGGDGPPDPHIVDGELAQPKLPLVLGHQIVATVAELGRGASRFEPGELVGAPWLGRTCGRCLYCRSGRENLCDGARFTGYTIDGGYAQETSASASRSRRTTRGCRRHPCSVPV